MITVGFCCAFGWSACDKSRAIENGVPCQDRQVCCCACWDPLVEQHSRTGAGGRGMALHLSSPWRGPAALRTPRAPPRHRGGWPHGCPGALICAGSAVPAAGRCTTAAAQGVRRGCACRRGGSSALSPAWLPSVRTRGKQEIQRTVNRAANSAKQQLVACMHGHNKSAVQDASE